MNENKTISKSWHQYEAGKQWKQRIGLYETVRRNERFYRGDQWRGGGDLPHPVFNIVRRITDYLVSSAAVGSIRISYSDDDLPAACSRSEAEAIAEGVRMLTESAAYRWENERVQSLIYRILYDAAITGDGFLYCWWDGDAPSVGDWTGEIRTMAADSVNIFPADVTNPDIQTQESVIVSGRTTLSAIRAEAREAGVPPEEYLRITPDDTNESPHGAGELGDIEPETDPEDAPVTYIIRFHRENGFVVAEKSARGCLIRRVTTPCRLYPIAHFTWIPTKDCFHGTAPVSGMIENQKYINRAFAMLLKHMTDTAFSKVIYDRTKIPEWTNEVGEAIAAVGGGNIADSVHTIGPGRLEEGYMEMIDKAIALTKELSGATETSLGNITPTNTSAILALRETSMQTLESVRSGLYRCIEEMAAIWADMTCAYCPDGRPLRTPGGIGRISTSRLRSAMLHARIDVSDSSHFSASGTQSILDSLLRDGHITVVEYLERLPDGLVPDRQALIEARKREASA